MRKAENGEYRKTDLKRLRDLFLQHQKAERMFEQFKAFCQNAYGQRIVDSLLALNPQPESRIEEAEGPTANQLVLQIVNKIDKPIFSSQEVIQMCNEGGHHYNPGTIYRALNKLGREGKLEKVTMSRRGKRAIDWKKTQPTLPFGEATVTAPISRFTRGNVAA